MYTTELFQPPDGIIQLFLIMYIYLDASFKKPFPGLHGEGIDIDFQFPRNQVGDLIDYTHIVYTYDADTRKERNFFVLGPLGFYHAVTVTGKQAGCIGAIRAVNRQPLSGGHKPEYIISRNGFTAIGQRI